MKKFCFIIFLAISVQWSCNRAETEIVVRLSDNEFLQTKYSSWFGENEGIDKESLNEDLRVSIRGELVSAKEEAINVLGKRTAAIADPVPYFTGLLDKEELTVTEMPESGTWSIRINRRVDPEKAVKLLTVKTECFFWETFKLAEIWDELTKANIAVRDAIASGELELEPDTSEAGKENPLFVLLWPRLDNQGQIIDGCEIGVSKVEDTATVNRILAHPSVAECFPVNLKPAWSLKALRGSSDYFALIALKISSASGLPLLTNKNIVGASVKSDRYPPVVSLVMDNEGAQLWSRITAENINRNIAVTMNSSVCFYPRVFMQVSGGNTEISADFTEEEAAELSILLGSGYMPPFGVEVVSVK